MSAKADITIEIPLPTTAPDKSRWEIVYAVAKAVGAQRVDLEESLELAGCSLLITRIGYERVTEL